MIVIDINCDMGEYPDAIADGRQESLMPHLTSVNIACGGHAGDDATMRTTVEQALRRSLALGAHPGYPDRANFGRHELEMPAADLAESIYRQVSTLDAIAQSAGGRLAHVKPHGALYNQAAKKADLARAIAEGVARHDSTLLLVGLAGSSMLDEFRRAGFRAAAEAFADRRYEADGSLRSRKFDDALIRNPDEAARQAERIAIDREVVAANGAKVRIAADTICIHGDTPGAPAIAAAVARRLRERGVELRSLER